MFTLESLHTGQISTIIIWWQHNIFLRDPGNGFICITVETLNLMGSKQLFLSHQSQLLESHPCLIQFLFARQDSVTFWMTFCHQLICQFIHFSHSIFLRHHVLLELIKFALKHLHMFQVMSKFIGGNKRFLVINPEHDFIALAQELHQHKRLLQLHPFLC